MTATSGNKQVVTRLHITLSFVILILGILNLPVQGKILLIQSEATKAYYSDQKLEGDPFLCIEVWEKQLDKHHFQVVVSNEYTLSEADSFSLIILPAVKCLSASSKEDLIEYLGKGGSLLLTHGVGTRDESGGWKGYQFMQKILGSAPGRAGIPAGEPAAIQMVYGHPGTTRLPPGYYYQIIPHLEPMFMQETDSLKVAGYWTSETYRESNPTRYDYKGAFCYRHTSSGGRIAWLGADILETNQDSTNQAIASYFLTDLIRWLSGEPIVSVEPWPARKRAAVLIQGDIEKDFANVVNVAELFRRAGVRTTFQILVSEIEKYPDALKEVVSSRGELGILSDPHTPFPGQPLGIQKQRLHTSIKELSDVSSYPMGFRPPGNEFDENTILAAMQLNLAYIAAFPVADRLYPRYRPYDPYMPSSGGLVFFNKGELDDSDLFVRFKLVDPITMTLWLTADFNHALKMGGLYTLNYHSSLLAQEKYIPVIGNLLNHIKKQEDVWIAPAFEIAEWSKQFNSLDLSYQVTDKGLEFSLQNTSVLPVKDVSLRVIPPNLSTASMYRPKATSRSTIYDVKDGHFFLYLPELKSGEIYEARLEKAGRFALSEGKKKIVYKLMFGIGAMVLIFLAWTIYYFTYAKRRYQASASISNSRSEYDDSEIEAFPGGYPGDDTVSPEFDAPGNSQSPPEEQAGNYLNGADQREDNPFQVEEEKLEFRSTANLQEKRVSQETKFPSGPQDEPFTEIRTTAQNPKDSQLYPDKNFHPNQNSERMSSNSKMRKSPRRGKHDDWV